MFDKYSYLGFIQVGKENAAKFWLPIQHADNNIDFQQEMLKKLVKEIKKNNAEKSHYALLEDRIVINFNKKQRFGTQVIYNLDRQAIPKNGLVDNANVDQLRLEYDLPTFKGSDDYKSFQMNKDYFLKQGITQPNLFK